MKIAVFSTKPYDEQFFDAANATHNHTIQYFEPRLTHTTASLANGYNCVCAFVNDSLDKYVLESLYEGGTRLIALRSAGFNHVDLLAAKALGLTVVRVPAYSPFAVAEHALAIILSLNRNIHRAFNRVREGNFALNGLLGFDLHGKTIGIVGTGKIGQTFAKILSGFGATLLAYDPYPNESLNDLVRYVNFEGLLQKSDVISLHCPLTPDTKHIINVESLSIMKRGAMLINTSRGALIDTAAVIDALKSAQLGYLGLDVYEEEADLFFEDLSNKIIRDDNFMRLLTFPNVIITGHQGFFTKEAVQNIAETTLTNISLFEAAKPGYFEVSTEMLA